MRLENAIGLLVGLAFGDVYGLEHEYRWSRPRELWLDVEDLDLGCFDECNGRCCYSDDTEMAMILAESILEKGYLDEDHFAQALASRGCRGYRARFYGYTTKNVIEAIRSGISWREASRALFGGRGSYGNGAAIRVAPIAIVAESLEEAIAWSERQAMVTHSHRLGIEGAILIAVAQRLVLEGVRPQTIVYELLDVHRWSEEYRYKLSSIEELLDDLPPKVARVLGNTSAAHESVVTAIYLFVKARDDPLKALAYAVSIGGDVDSIAAMALSLIGAYKGYEVFREDLVAKIEKIEYIKILAKELHMLRHLRKLRAITRR